MTKHLLLFSLSVAVFLFVSSLSGLFSARAVAGPAALTDPAAVVTPANLPRPAPNLPVQDTTFGTTLRRVSNSSEGTGFETQSYSQLQAFSHDNVYLLLESWDGYIVRRVRDFSLVNTINSAGWNAPRWYGGQAHTLVHFDSNEDTTLRVQLTNVDSGQTVTHFTFPAGYERIRSARSFDELSRDGRWLGGFATRSNGDQTIFALDMQNRTLGAQISLEGLYSGPCAPDPQWGIIEPDWIGVSPLGRYLVVQWPRDGIERCSGQETFDLNTGAFVGRVYDGHAHGDLGVLPDGTTEFFMTFELGNPEADGGLSIGYRVLPGTATVQEPVYIQVMDWHAAHISCQGPDGVCLVTTDAVPENGWQALEAELFLQYTDGRVERLVHHRSSSCGYWLQPRATLSRDGRYAVFASDWAQQTGSNGCDGSNEGLGRGDPYVLELAGGTPVQTPTATATATTDGGRPTTETATASATASGTSTQVATATASATPSAMPSATPSATPTRIGAPPQAHVLLYTTLDDPEAISAPVAGIGGGSSLQQGDFVAGRLAQGAWFQSESRVAWFPVAQGGKQNIDFDRGELRFWYRPDYPANADDVVHTLLVAGDVYNVPRLSLSEGDRLAFSLVDGDWNEFVAVAPYRAPLWQAGEWIYVRVVWDRSSPDPIQLFVNDQRVDEGAATGGWNLGDGTGQTLFVGAGNQNGDFSAAGVIDDLIIYSEAPPEQTATPTATVTAATATATPTPTASPTVPNCPQPTPVLLEVAPVTSPTSAYDQTVSVRFQGDGPVRITTVSGEFSGTGPGDLAIPVTLWPGITHRLVVEGSVPAWSVGGCSYSGYTLRREVDRNGQPLVIQQQPAAQISLPSVKR